MKINFNTILQGLIATGITWLIYTTVHTQSDVVLIDYKIEQIHSVLQKHSEQMNSK